MGMAGLPQTHMLQGAILKAPQSTLFLLGVRNAIPITLMHHICLMDHRAMMLVLLVFGVELLQCLGSVNGMGIANRWPGNNFRQRDMGDFL